MCKSFPKPRKVLHTGYATPVASARNSVLARRLQVYFRRANGASNMTEKWKDIATYEGLYAVSNTGKVKSHRRNIILAPRVGTNGYARVVLCKRYNKSRTIHSLVIEAFKGPKPMPHMECRHIDGNYTNNHISNLEWGTKKQN